MPLRIAAVFAAALCLAATASAVAVESPAPPQGLRAFLLRPDEPATRVYPRTPSFAWQPVPGASSYDFQLARSPEFTDETIVYRASAVGTPALAVPLVLPWMNGQPYALYARVRALKHGAVSPWSRPFGFDTSWETVPQPLPAAPGLVRWTPVPGATGYEVWYPDAGKAFSTLTNVADEREFYTFHQDAHWIATVRWRVRAFRRVFGDSPGGIPVVSYGPWSGTYVSKNPPLAARPLKVGRTLADDTAPPHGLTPGFAWAGDQDADGRYHPLYRVYVFTDSRCVNVVYRGAIVGSPAYAPRSTGPLQLPTDDPHLQAAASLFLEDGTEPKSFTADYLAVTSNEAVTQASGSGSGQDAGGTSATTGGAAGAGTSIAADQTLPGALVDLWDSGRPNGRYYWTVVPVEPTTGKDGSLEYRDVELAQDVCAAGRRAAFSKHSWPAVTSAGAAYVSGLSPQGRLVAATGAAPAFYGAPLVAWEPVFGALQYEVEVSAKPYPWKAVTRTTTFGTSALLSGLTPGTWYYRVRGLDPYIPGPSKVLGWSAPQEIELTKPVFSVSRG